MRVAPRQRFCRAVLVLWLGAAGCSRYDDEPGASRLPRGTLFRCSVTLELIEPSRGDAAALPRVADGNAESQRDPPEACKRAIEAACESVGAAPSCVEDQLYRKAREDYDW